jgi:hypothetical protein
MGFQSLFSSMEGRIGRGTYWIGLIGIAVVSFVAGLILWRIFGEHLILTGGGRFAQFVVVMALLYPGYCVMAKRFQDRNESRSYRRGAVPKPAPASCGKARRAARPARAGHSTGIAIGARRPLGWSAVESCHARASSPLRKAAAER